LTGSRCVSPSSSNFSSFSLSISSSRYFI
jgi:hypothetical protein